MCNDRCLPLEVMYLQLVLYFTFTIACNLISDLSIAKSCEDDFAIKLAFQTTLHLHLRPQTPVLPTLLRVEQIREVSC